jgi:hypothetical protein
MKCQVAHMVAAPPRINVRWLAVGPQLELRLVRDPHIQLIAPIINLTRGISFCNIIFENQFIGMQQQNEMIWGVFIW